jgi:N-acetylglucosamine-6-phosphate deacetylase
LPAAVVKSMLRAKTPARCVLVSDITGLAGQPPGRYQTGLGEIEVLASGKLVPAGQPQLLAGAALPMHYCVPRAMQFGEIDLETAIHLASTQPAAIIGLERHDLEIGAQADLVLFDLADPLVIRATILRGKTVWGHA